MSRLSGWLQEGGLYLLLFLLPFSKAAIEISFGLLLLGWLLMLADPRGRARSVWVRPAFRPLASAFAAFAAVCALSIAVSDHRALSLEGFVEKWLQYLLFSVIVADILQRPAVRERSLAVLLWSVGFVVVEAVSQELWGRGLFRGYRLAAYGRMTGPYENPIDLATYFMVTWLVLLPATMSQRGARRWLGAAVLLAALLCMTRTVAIGAWLGLAAGLVVVLSGLPVVRRAAAWLLIPMVLAGIFALQHTGGIGQVWSPSEIGKRDRLTMWQAALGMIRDRPLLGHGVNTFMANYLDYWVGGERQPRYAHNCYLQVAAETGLIGLAAFLSLLGWILWRLCAVLQQRPPDEQMLLLGILSGLLAFLLQAGVDTNFYAMRQAALFWVMAGFGLGVSAAQEPG